MIQTNHVCLKSVCECVLVSRVFPKSSTWKKSSVCRSKNICTCGGWKDEVWGNFTVKWNERWNYRILFYQDLSMYVYVCLSACLSSVLLLSFTFCLFLPFCVLNWINWGYSNFWVSSKSFNLQHYLQFCLSVCLALNLYVMF